ncbi:hypothetical protein KBY91_03020 [Streptomyces sp. RK23]|uniref:DUF5819 family protein n=1 Tax=Streptomyces TaxID=1883 RepID=UPI00136FF9EF|nr:MULTISPECIES: DUF5819 family protein [unclassified Streptomyces]MBQ0962791.1 hypothetical protein [Streptomyces sp. RK74B]MBQ1002393.1 hypothetical protein [Streptomyces sp. RK23]
MDAYDKGSDARHGQDGPGGPAGPDLPESEADPAETTAPETDGAPDTAGAREVAGVPEAADVPEVAGAHEADVPETAGVPEVAGAEAAGAAEVAGAVRAAPPGTAQPPAPRTGVAALSPRYQVGAVVALAVVAVAVCAHIGMVFLHLAPSNTLTKQHGDVVDEWVFPEFEQNWKLFAPNPLQQNVSVQVRAEVSTADGEIRTTGWYDLSAEDGRAIDGNPLPSHTQQNELRRAWDFFVASHDSDDRPVGLRGTLSETYLRRIALLRLDRDGAAGPGGVVERVQYRSRTTNVEPPPWSGEKVSDRPTVRELPWWSVAAETRGAKSGQAGQAAREGGAA